MKERVFVGMSGGVDSSVAAKRLIDRGYDVVGVFIKVWQPNFIQCNWENERLDAMRVAAHLGIPFLTMNAAEAYKTKVADYMIDSYRRGLTPNPDVMCNEYVKFGAFYEWARENGADKIATGHYARVEHSKERSSLLRGIDTAKDQSYFLSRIHQEALDHTLFPIGDTRKDDLRQEARSAGLSTASKPDSQGICFLGEIDMYTFLSHYIDLREGPVLNESGAQIGTHRGAVLYTSGQRHGFFVSENPDQKPHYVISRDVRLNSVTVSTSPLREHGTSVLLSDLNELGDGFGNGMLTAVSRYHGRPVEVTVTRGLDGHATLVPTTTDTHDWVKGQTCALYRNESCVGSGVIS